MQRSRFFKAPKLRVGSRTNPQSDPFESVLKYMMKTDLELKLNKQEEVKQNEAESDEQRRIDDERRYQLMFQQQQLAQQQTNAILQHLINVNQINNNISSKTSVVSASTTSMNFQPPLKFSLPVKDYTVDNVFNSSKKHNNSMNQESTSFQENSKSSQKCSKSFQESSIEIVDGNEEYWLFHVIRLELRTTKLQLE